MKGNGMGVLYLVAHLIITLVLIGGYMYTLHIGQPDETLKIGIATVLGYWFGAVGMDKIKSGSNKNKKEGSENE